MSQPNLSHEAGGSAGPRRKGAGLAALALFACLVACLGGGLGAYLLVERLQPRGSANPAQAIDGFLTAVFDEKDPGVAARFVCPDSRDERQLATLVYEIATFEARYDSSPTSWTYPTVEVATSRRSATATIELTLTQGRNELAQKRIRLILVDDHGWWVCDVEEAD